MEKLQPRIYHSQFESGSGNLTGKPPDRDPNTLKHLYWKKGMSINDIAARYKETPAEIRKWFIDAAIPRRPGNTAQRKPHVTSSWFDNLRMIRESMAKGIFYDDSWAKVLTDTEKEILIRRYSHRRGKPVYSHYQIEKEFELKGKDGRAEPIERRALSKLKTALVDKNYSGHKFLVREKESWRLVPEFHLQVLYNLLIVKGLNIDKIAENYQVDKSEVLAWIDEFSWINDKRLDKIRETLGKSALAESISITKTNPAEPTPETTPFNWEKENLRHLEPPDETDLDKIERKMGLPLVNSGQTAHPVTYASDSLTRMVSL